MKKWKLATLLNKRYTFSLRNDGCEEGTATGGKAGLGRDAQSDHQ